MRPNLGYGLLVLALTLLSIYCNLGVKPIYKTQELRVAETAREMVTSGEWLIPHYNGEPRLRKPPLAYWLTGASYLAFGRISEFTARFASATFALLTVLMLFVWQVRSLGRESALATGLCFMSSYMALRYFRSAETDAILLFFVSAACLLAYRMVQGKAGRHTVPGMYLVMGLGFLVKGPAALVIPLLTLGVLSWAKRDGSALRQLWHPIGLAALALTAFGWYALIFLKLPDLASHWVGEEIDATYLGGGRPNPVYWYLPALFKLYAPWSLFILPAAIWLYRSRPLPAAAQFALIWFGVTFIVLSVNVSKQVQYALLLNPPLAILLGHYLADARQRFAFLNRWVYALLLGSFGAVGVWLATTQALSASDIAVIAVLGCSPLLLARGLGIDMQRHGLALLLTGFMAASWSQGQENRYTESSDEVTVRRFAIAVRDYEPLFIHGPANARISFYAGRVIPHVPPAELQASVRDKKHPIHVITQNEQALPDAHLVLHDGDFRLWRLPPALRVSDAE